MSNPDIERALYINYVHDCIGLKNVEQATGTMFVPNIIPDNATRMLTLPKDDRQFKFAKKYWQVRKEFLSEEMSKRIKSGFDFYNSDAVVFLDIFVDMVLDKATSFNPMTPPSEAILDFESSRDELLASLGFYDGKEEFSKVAAEINIIMEYFFSELTEYVKKKFRRIEPKSPMVVRNPLEIVTFALQHSNWEDAQILVINDFIATIIENKEIVLVDSTEEDAKNTDEAITFLTYFSNYINNISAQRKKDENNA